MIKKIITFSLVTLIVVPTLFFQVHFLNKKLNKKKDAVISKHKRLIVKEKKESDEVSIVLCKLGFEIFRDHHLKGVGIGLFCSMEFVRRGGDGQSKVLKSIISLS